MTRTSPKRPGRPKTGFLVVSALGLCCVDEPGHPARAILVPIGEADRVTVFSSLAAARAAMRRTHRVMELPGARVVPVETR